MATLEPGAMQVDDAVLASGVPTIRHGPPSPEGLLP